MTVMDMIIILGAGLGAVVVGLVLHRVPATWRPDSESPTAKVLVDLNKTLFAFVMALSIVSAWGSLKDAQGGSIREANALADVYWVASVLPDPERSRFQQLVRDYTKTVVEVEWPAMAERQTSPEAARLLDTLRHEVNRYTTTGADEVKRRDTLTAVREAMEERRERVLRLDEGIPDFLWVGLLLSAALILIMPAFQGGTFGLSWAMNAFLLGVLVAAPMTLVAELNHPFSGISVTPDAFVKLLGRFDQITSIKTAS
ncbi:hypothetical protein Lesp02_38050 [Lentzea sp. NBRC 105346]|uniref:bestrophin-like domain n=1 Tax=Lentzea sp. NBRC 105346 TaxID=3032205 RepID=UPI0024A43224|nr:DUF4239 domain-containing protein [Lentzea sp. NBRC 105346]GLZ31617.1 hypothetical protein Lesp02_38050 [Lentzea sp. NBRC 105346]